MIGYDFIFSNRIFFRISRHLAFWLAVSIWFLYAHNGDIFQQLPICLLTTYTTLYFLIPRYLLHHKYREVGVALLVFSILYPLLFIFNPITYFSDPDKFISDHAFVFDNFLDRQDVLVWKVGQWNAWGLTMFLSGFAAVIKLLKLYYLENTENKRLQGEKVNHELQLLKSQLTSNFIFDALQTISRHVRNQSSASSGLILNLSDFLSYILYENEEKSVPLHKEIEIIEGYLKFENESRGNMIDIGVTQNGEIDEKKIVPLVVLPLIESCFEHLPELPDKGAGLFLDFNVQGLVLNVTLKTNNLRGLGHESCRKSIRLKNVKQRLESYYTGRHQLDISENCDSYIVQLELAL